MSVNTVGSIRAGGIQIVSRIASQVVVLLSILVLAGCFDSAPPRPQPFVGPDAASGGLVVTGMAYVEFDDTLYYSAHDEPVLLVPVNAASDKWVDGLLKYVPGSRGEPPSHEVPEAIKRGARQVIGADRGEFAFSGVAPGSYYVVFHHGYYTAATIVTVRKGTNLGNVEVARHLRSAITK